MIRTNIAISARIHKLQLLVVVLCLFLSGTASAQELTFEAAAKEMLEKNFDVRIVENNKEIAEESNHPGNADMLPSVDAGVDYEKAVMNTEQLFLDGRENSRNNAQSSNFSASLMLNWTVFDGFRMFATKDILESNEQVSEYYLRAASEEAMMMLASLYYRVIQQQKLLEVQKEALDISRERYGLAVKRQQLGNGSRQEVIQAQLDMHADSSNVLSQKTSIANLKTELNLLLAREPMSVVEVSNSIPIDTTIELNDMMEGTGKMNVDLLIARENTRVAINEVKQAKSSYYPKVGVFAGYNYIGSKSEAGFLQSNQSFGPSIGFSVNFNLFNGLKDYKNIQVQQIERENSFIEQEKATMQSNSQLLRHYREYGLARNLYRLERQNIAKAEENQSIALKKFELGNISSVEFREIQQQLVRAQARLLEARYSIRMKELELKKIAGTLLIGGNNN